MAAVKRAVSLKCRLWGSRRCWHLLPPAGPSVWHSRLLFICPPSSPSLARGPAYSGDLRPAELKAGSHFFFCPLRGEQVAVPASRGHFLPQSVPPWARSWQRALPGRAVSARRARLPRWRWPCGPAVSPGRHRLCQILREPLLQVRPPPFRDPPLNSPAVGRVLYASQSTAVFTPSDAQKPLKEEEES